MANLEGHLFQKCCIPNVEELRQNYLKVMAEPDFKKEFDQLLKDYVGRPTPLYFATRLSAKYNTKIYLKREDLCHTGAHKINNTIGQILMAKTEKKAHHCGNWRWTTRSGNSDCLCFSRLGVYCVYGRN